MNIRTYCSENAPARMTWIAYIDQGFGDYLPVRFNGATEDEARAAAQAEWDKYEAEREANIARREEARRKAAETRARKQKVGA
jgi:hypothetical protein